jgi:hypothetical protein
MGLGHALVAADQRRDGHALVRAGGEVPPGAVLVRGRLRRDELNAVRAAAFEEGMEGRTIDFPSEPEPLRATTGPLTLPLLRVVLVVVPARVLLRVVVAGLDDGEGLGGAVHGSLSP